jgi:phenylalanyl-tRNA synthetase beta chain
MKIAYNWLEEYVDLPEDPRKLGSDLTLVGLAVDTMETTEDGPVFDLDITTNRPDCLNHVGVAREVHALYGAPLRYPDFAVEEGARPVTDAFSVEIDAPDLCGRYCGRYIAGVKVGPSPDWLRKRLESVGIRSVNNVVDVTNYVLMELGQPLHAFDADTLRGGKIVVRRAAPDEPMTTHDGGARKLNPSVLVIADAERPVALAGIMGGADAEISASSTNVFLESAWFDPQNIRRSARALGMNTEASYRFERGADIGIALHAVDRAARLIRQVAGGEVHAGALDNYPVPALRLPIPLRRGRIAALLGAEVENDSLVRIFGRLGFALFFESDPWRVLPPTFRLDVQTEEDLIEEVARHYGYDRFPSTRRATR